MKSIVLLATCFALVSVAKAQAPSHLVDRQQFRHNHGHHGQKGHIHFTDVQKKQWKDLQAGYRLKQSDLFKQDNLTLGQYKAQLLTLNKERKSAMQNLLTPEQKAQMNTWKKEMAENRQVKAAAKMERMKIRLQLNDQQEAAIKSQWAGNREQLKTIRENDQLLPQEKREEMRALLLKQKESMLAVLTPEQRTRMEHLKSHHMHQSFQGHDN